jgi:hypothetical protein
LYLKNPGRREDALTAENIRERWMPRITVRLSVDEIDAALLAVTQWARVGRESITNLEPPGEDVLMSLRKARAALTSAKKVAIAKGNAENR